MGRPYTRPADQTLIWVNFSQFKKICGSGEPDNAIVRLDQMYYSGHMKTLFRIMGVAGRTPAATDVVRWLSALLLVLMLFPAYGARGVELGTPRLSEPMDEGWLMGRDRLLTSGGVKYGAGESLTLEPLIGLGYGMRRFEQFAGTGARSYKVHAEAGGKVNLLQSLYFSAAAKMPLYSYETAVGRDAGPPAMTSFSRHEYDFLRLPGSNFTWTGEVGVRLGLGADLTFYYDQNLFLPAGGGPIGDRPEDRFGTRIIFRFK
jgi:hypothetical protein